LNEVTLEGIKYVFEKGLMTFTEEDLYHYFTWPNSIPGGMIDVLLYLIDALPFNPNYTNKVSSNDSCVLCLSLDIFNALRGRMEMVGIILVIYL
jgi:hypothetical protein